MDESGSYQEYLDMQRKWRQGIFNRAADIIEKRGWCQKTRMDETTGAVCLIGAIALALNRDTVLGLVDYQFCRDLQERLPIPMRERYSPLDLEEWNDRSRTSKRQVLKLLRGEVAQ
jgi:hypothetical protein